MDEQFLLLEWLHGFEDHLLKSAERKAVLFVYDASYHGNVYNLSNLRGTSVPFLTMKTKSCL